MNGDRVGFYSQFRITLRRIKDSEKWTFEIFGWRPRLVLCQKAKAKVCRFSLASFQAKIVELWQTVQQCIGELIWNQINSQINSQSDDLIWFQLLKKDLRFDLKINSQEPKISNQFFFMKMLPNTWFFREFGNSCLLKLGFFFNFPHPMKLWKFSTLKFKRQRKSSYYLRWK